MAVERGVVGLLVLCSLFVVIFKSSYHFSKFSFIFLLYSYQCSQKNFLIKVCFGLGWRFMALRKTKDYLPPGKGRDVFHLVNRKSWNNGRME